MPGEYANTTVLEARNLTCIRGGWTLFASLSFLVAPGRALILRGPNGSGKTSLLRIVAGLLSADEGELRWAGVGGNDAINAIREDIHLIGHLTALKPVLSVKENISIWARLNSADGGTAESLAAMGISELAELPVRFLSEGQKRRTALARLIAHQKPIWLLDEPLAGLDARSVDRLMGVINDHLSAGGIALIATHQALPMDTSRQSDLQIGGGP